MEALGQIISMLLSYVVNQIGDALNADIKRRVFIKESEIQNAVIENLQNQYAALEGKIAEAETLQFQQQLADETKSKVVRGNLISLIVAIVIMAIVIGVVVSVLKGKK